MAKNYSYVYYAFYNKWIKKKRSTYKTVLSDTSVNTELAGTLLNDVEFEGWVMKNYIHFNKK